MKVCKHYKPADVFCEACGIEAIYGLKEVRIKMEWLIIWLSVLGLVLAVVAVLVWFNGMRS